MFFLRVHLFGTYEDLGMRRHPRGRTQPRKQTECLAFIDARRRGARGLARAGGTDLGAQLAPARRIAAGARGPPWRQKARLQAKEPHKLASGRMRRGANPDSVLHSDTSKSNPLNFPPVNLGDCSLLLMKHAGPDVVK